MTVEGQLSEREVEILQLVSSGMSNRQVAHRLTISPNTVKVHLHNIFAKMEVASRTEASTKAIQQGIVPGPDGTTNQPNALDMRGSSDRLLGRYSLRDGRVLIGLVVLGLILAVGIWAIGRSRSSSSTEFTAPPQTDESRWEIASQMGSPRSRFATVAANNLIYLIGGQSEGRVTGHVERFDIDDGSWKSLASKPTAVEDVKGAILQGQIWVPGGRLASGQVSDAFEIFDPRDSMWTEGPRLPMPLSAYALTVFEGSLYLFGGWNGEEYVSTVLQYSPGQDSWETLTPMPSARGYAEAAAAGGTIIVMGGFDGETALSSTYAYSPELEGTVADPWDARAPMPEARYGMGVASVADVIHVIGGERQSTEEAALFRYSPHEDSWRISRAFHIGAKSHLGVAALGTSLYALGGEELGVPSRDTVRYQAIYTILIPVLPVGNTPSPD